MSLSMWRNASTRRKRILSTIVILVIATVITAVGAFMPINAQDAQTISNDLNQTANSLSANNALTPYIFGNNFMICLIMFIPIAGPIFGFYVLYNTGIAVGAVATTQGYPSFVALFAEFLTPIFWLEFISYSIAITESIWLLRRMMQHSGTREIKNTGVLVTFCAAVLFLSAIIETALISVGA